MAIDERLSQYLIDNDLASAAALASAQREQAVTGRALGLILVRGGFVRQAEMTRAILAVAPAHIDEESTFVNSLPAGVLIDTQTMVLAETPEALFCATLMPEHMVAPRLRDYDPRPAVFRPAAIERIDAYFAELGRVARSDEDSLLDRLLRQALRRRFSDLHVLPRHESYTVQGRYLGELQHVHEGELAEYNVLAARIKDRANMDLSERRVPQSGGFSVEYKQRLVDMRVEAIPALTGEKLVIRLLDPDAVNPKLATLGITRLAEWRKGFTRRNGLCLICGPTGSGKTTTLNATVREMDRFGRHICSIEDPVEYALPFITQVNVNYAVGLDFSKALRSFMRLDPDVIIQGEVRDEETAALAIKAAETGHLVLATLHTSSISTSLERLEYLGVRRLDLKYLLRAVLVQSLIRVVCHACGGHGACVQQGAGARQSTGTGPQDHATPAGLPPAGVLPAGAAGERSCEVCGGNGFTHRTIVSECAYFPNEAAVSRLLEGERDWPLLIEDALAKYRQGMTTREEMQRVFAEEATPYLGPIGAAAPEGAGSPADRHSTE